MSVKDIVLSAAGSAGSPVYVDDVFSNYVYSGTGYRNYITNNIPLTTTGAFNTFTHDNKQNTTSSRSSVATDSSGNIYIAYRSSTDSNRISLIKFTSSGSVDWSRQFYQNTTYHYGGLAVNSSGDVFVCGSLNDGTNSYAAVLKYDSSGTLQWQKKILQGSSTTPYDLVIDSSSNVYIVGQYYVNGSTSYAFTLKLDTSGSLQWQRYFRVAYAYATGLALDSSNNVYMSCYEDSGFYIIKYNSSGSIQWQVNNNDAGGKLPYGITVDSSGNVYVGSDLGIHKFDTSGNFQWTKTLLDDNGSGIALKDLACDSSDNVYGIGTGQNTGSEWGSGSNHYYVSIVKYNSSGTIQWQSKVEDRNSYAALKGRAICTDSSGGVHAFVDMYSWPAVINLKQDGTTPAGYVMTRPDNTLFTTNISDYLTPGKATVGTRAGTSTSGSGTDSAGGMSVSSGAATDVSLTGTANTYSQSAVTNAGGLVWIKDRTAARSHNLYDTSRGVEKGIFTDSTSGQVSSDSTGYVSEFNVDGFTLKKGSSSFNGVNLDTDKYVSWTFRKQAKFFDIVTWTGNGVAGRQIAHNLGSAPGFMIVKNTSRSGDDWTCWHRSINSGDNVVWLNLSQAADVGGAGGYFGNGGGSAIPPTSEYFTVGSVDPVNLNGQTYVAYLFAHNAGGFGLTGTDNVISCGSYTGNGSTTGPVINLGYEPQWILIKRYGDGAGATGHWVLLDNMRGLPVTATATAMATNLSAAESSFANLYSVGLTPTGFQLKGTSSDINANNSKYIYIAIRRPMKPPTSGTEVFQPLTRTGTGALTTVTNSNMNFVDFAFSKNNTDTAAGAIVDRTRGNGYLLFPAYTSGQTNPTGYPKLDVMKGYQADSIQNFNQSSLSFVNYLFKRASSFFDIVGYTGDGTSNRALNHNLTVAPEMIIVKATNNNSYSWLNYHKYTSATPFDDYMMLNGTDGFSSTAGVWGSSLPTSTEFRVGNFQEVNYSSTNYVAYLFTTLAGVSKLGSYTGTAGTQTINCGFGASGARFVLVKSTNAAGSWFVFDTARGMTSSSSPYIRLNLDNAQTSGDNGCYASSTGFTLTSAGSSSCNQNGVSYIYLAIA